MKNALLFSLILTTTTRRPRFNHHHQEGTYIHTYIHNKMARCRFRFRVYGLWFGGALGRPVVMTYALGRCILVSGRPTIQSMSTHRLPYCLRLFKRPRPCRDLHLPIPTAFSPAFTFLQPYVAPPSYQHTSPMIVDQKLTCCEIYICIYIYIRCLLPCHT